METIIKNNMPTRNDLNERLSREAKAVYDTATENDLTSSYSEVEVKYQIRNELYEIFMSDEMVQALMLKDNILEDAYRFYLAENKDNQAFLAVSEYLEEQEHDYIANKIYDRMRLEYKEYIDGVKELPPEEIIDVAYEIAMAYDIQCAFDPPSTRFTTEQLKALMSLDNLTWSLFSKWRKFNDSLMDDINTMVDEFADRLIKEAKGNDYETEPNYLGERESLSEDELEP